MTIDTRIKETTTGVGTGNLNLDVTVDRFFDFSANGLADSRKFYYCIEHTILGEVEVGIGSWASDHLIRESVLKSSNSDSLVSFSAGVKNVFITIPGGVISVGTTDEELTLTDNNNGVITVTKSFHIIDTASDATHGALLTIKGSGASDTAVEGDRLTLAAASTARVIELKHTEPGGSIGTI